MSDRIEKIVELSGADLPMGESAQPVDEADRWTPDHAIEPPANLDALAALTQAARTRRSCIEAVTLNTVSRGVTLAPREGHEEEVADDEIAEVLAKLDAMARRDDRLVRPSLTRLLSAAKWDEEEVGNGYLEVSRNRVTGEIDGLFHVPGKRVRRRRDRKGWVVGPKSGSFAERVEFYDFGDKVRYENGRPTATLVNSGRRWDRNELIPFRLYTSESRDYGLPRDSQLALDYLGDRNAAESNVAFFDSSGVPPTVIFVQGEPDENGKIVRFKVSEKLVKQITDTLSADSDRRKRVAVVPVPPGTKTDKIDLAALSERDMGFIEFRRDNRRATLGAFRMAPIFVADIEDTNYSTAETEERLTKKQLFDPEQERWADILSDSILRDMGYPHLEFKFTELEVGDEKQRAEAADAMAEHKAILNGEYRKAHGMGPLPEAKEGEEPEPGQVEYGWNGAIVTVGVGDGGHEAIQRGAEAAATLLAEGKAGMGGVPVGIEAGA